jgi:hypothetical protein
MITILEVVGRVVEFIRIVVELWLLLRRPYPKVA